VSDENERRRALDEVAKGLSEMLADIVGDDPELKAYALKVLGEAIDSKPDDDR